MEPTHRPARRNPYCGSDFAICLRDGYRGAMLAERAGQGVSDFYQDIPVAAGSCTASSIRTYASSDGWAIGNVVESVWKSMAAWVSFVLSSTPVRLTARSDKCS